MQRTNFLFRGKATLAALAFAALLHAADASTLTVNTTTDDGSGTCTQTKCTLRDAILHASLNDQITFSLPANSTVALTSGPLSITTNIVIKGPGAGLLTIARSSAAGIAHFRILNIPVGTRLDLSGVTISNGLDDTGDGVGGIHNLGILSVTACTISGNTSTTGAGGILNSGTLSVNNSTISGNSASFRGGAIYNIVSNNGDLANVTITNSTISDNTAHATGGGIANVGNGPKLTISNCTISGNTASGGGAIYNNSTDSTDGLTITNSTISGNTASSTVGGSGGGIYIESGRTCKLTSSIVAKNTGPIGPDIYNSGTASTVTSQGYNLIGNNQNTNMTATTGDQIGTPANPIDPLLDPLHDNGGPTQTQKLLTNSPAIDKGTSGGSTSDQRGFTRPVDTPIANASDGSDIGAYEVQADEMAAGCASVIVTNVNDAGTGSLRGVITAACGGSTITFARNVRGAINLTSGELALNKNLIINGPGANLLTVQRSASASTNFRIFHITGNFRDAISGLTISNGAGPADASGNKGGGILNSGGTLTLSNDTVSLNTAIGGNGGGIYSSGTLNVSGSTISGNKIDSPTPGSGGGIFNFGGTITVTNSTISGNSALSGPGGTAGTTDHGGGIYSNTGTVTIVSSTITANNADNGGGILGENGASFSAASTIIARNTSPKGPDSNGSLRLDGYDLLGTNAQTTLLGQDDTDQVGTPASPIDPLLGPLQDNGGPTLTHALQPGSPALDKGSAGATSTAPARTTDQRGLPRPSDNPGISNATFGDGSDIGAFELQVSALVNLSTRLKVETGDNVLFAGLIVTGAQPKKVIVRALGPSVQAPGILADPILELYQGNTLLETNDNWVDSPNKQAIIDSTVAPTNNLESAIVRTLPANATTYTAIVRGVNNGTGIGVVEIYDLDSSADSKLANISTRGLVQTGDDVLIAGTIVVGEADQKLLICALGPSLSVQGPLSDPTLELRDSSGTVVASNDNWVDSPDKQAIMDTGAAPPNNLESAIIHTVSANGAIYTAVVRGVNSSTGVAVVEVFALN
jgi:CSLREA domain-containing protein